MATWGGWFQREILRHLRAVCLSVSMKSWMALVRRVILAGSPGRHFRQSCGVPRLFGVILFTVNLWQETTGQLSEEYTSSCIVFNKSQERSRLVGRN